MNKKEKEKLKAIQEMAQLIIDYVNYRLNREDKPVTIEQLSKIEQQALSIMEEVKYF